MCLNAVTKLLEYRLPPYQPIRRHSEFEELFIVDFSHPSYYWNAQTYTSLSHSLLVAFTNYTCVKYYMSSQAYKVVNAHAHEISG